MFKAFLSFCILFSASFLLAIQPAQATLQDEFNRIAPFVPKDPDKDLAALEDARSKLGKVMDSVGRDGMIVCGGQGNIRRLRG